MKILAGSKRAQILHNPKWILTGVDIAVIAVAAMTTWHLMGEPGKSSEAPKSLSITNNEAKKAYRNESSPIEILLSDTPKQSILAEDGASMHFVPAGMVVLPQNSKLVFGSELMCKLLLKMAGAFFFAPDRFYG